MKNVKLQNNVDTSSQNGNLPYDVKGIIDNWPNLFPEMTNFGETVPEPDKYILTPYLPEEKLTLVFGFSGVLKSTLCHYIAAKFTVGGELFGQEVKEGPVLYVAAEGTKRTIYDGIKRLGGDTSKVTASEKAFSLDRSVYGKAGLDYLYETTEKRKPILTVLDPGYKFLGNSSMNDTQKVSEFLDDLEELCKEYHTTMIVAHPRGKKKDAILLNDTILGATAWEAYHRSILYVHNIVKADPFDLNPITHSVVFHSKSSNEIAGKPIDLIRTKEGLWVKDSAKITEEEILNYGKEDNSIDFYLQKYIPLEEEVDEAEFTIKMRAMGFSAGQIHRARAKNGVKCRPEGKGKTRRSILWREDKTIEKNKASYRVAKVTL